MSGTNEEDFVDIFFDVSEELNDALEEWAKKMGVSTSTAVRIILTQDIERKKQEDPEFREALRAHWEKASPDANGLVLVGECGDISKTLGDDK